MKIGIILHPYGESKQTGLGEYILDLTKSLIERDEENEYIIFLKDKPKQMPVFSGENCQIKILGFGKFWRDLGLFFAPRADVYIFNTPIMPLFFRPKKSIVIALDFAYLYFQPQTLNERINNLILFWLNKLFLRRADLIVAISKATKNDVINFFSVSADKIRVIYPGFRNLCLLPEKEISVKKPYFLFVGAIKERKNVLNIVLAFINFKKKYRHEHRLIVAGKKSGNYFNKILNIVEKENMREEVIFTDYVDIHHLSYLYKNAAVLVFPSLVEGFGFPVLEAMSCGLPVITSNISSLPEVADEAAIAVDPLDIEKISEAMHRIVTDEVLKRDLVVRGFARAEQFSWKKCAEKFLEVIKNL